MKMQGVSLDSLKNVNSDIFELLNGSLLEEDLIKIRQSKKITISQLKDIYTLGVNYYNSFQFKEAEAVFSSYTFLNPYDHRGPGGLASIYLEQHSFSRALGVLNVLKTYPTNDLDETMLNISLCHYKLNEFKQAVATLLIITDPAKLNSFNFKRYQYLQQQLNPYLS